MPLFHIAIDIIERDWITIEAPDVKTAYNWGKANAITVYEQTKRKRSDVNLEFPGEIERVPPNEEKYYTASVRIT